MKILLIPLILLSYGVIGNMIEYGYGVNDAFWRVIWWIDEGTIWAPGFSEKNFSKIKKGMSKKEVFTLMGKPLRGFDDCNKDYCGWVYTKNDSPTSDFDQRWVFFNRRGKVIEIRKSFYID